jgi:hypothetical protein
VSPPLSFVADARKYLWDGQAHETADEAARAEGAYRQQRFETRVREWEGKFLIYTRRVAEPTGAA